jgi:hypothetical protein
VTNESKKDMKDKKKIAALLSLVTLQGVLAGYETGKPKWMSKDKPCKNCGKMREDPIGDYCNRKCRDEFVNKTTGMS